MIRRATSEDAEDIRRIYAPMVLESIASFETEVPSADEIRSRLSQSHEWLVCERGDQIVGYAYAGAFRSRAAYRWSVEVSIYLGKEARGSGLGRELLTELTQRLIKRGFVNAFAGIALPNPVSVALFEGLGFEKIAQERAAGFKLGGWHDVGWWQLCLCEPPVPPPEIT